VIVLRENKKRESEREEKITSERNTFNLGGPHITPQGNVPIENKRGAKKKRGELDRYNGPKQDKAAVTLRRERECSAWLFSLLFADLEQENNSGTSHNRHN